MAAPERKIMLVDMNSYFASVEQQCNPYLRGKPVAICGEGRTIVVTASYEARAYGVKTGCTKPEARRLCPHIIFVVGDLEKYVDTSLKIHEILLQFTDRVEVFSIDECFMDVTDTESLFGGAYEIALRIKRDMFERLGLKCSIGIGPGRGIAKIAAKRKKPDGLTIIKPEEVPAIFGPIPVEEMQGSGIGRKTAYKLRTLGIRTAGDLAAYPLEKLTHAFGVWGHVLKSIATGRDLGPVRTYLDQDPVKSVGHSHTMARDTFNHSVIRSYLLMLSEKVARRMRKYKVKGRTVSMFIRYEDFTHFWQRHTAGGFIDSGADICARAWDIFKQEFPLEKAVRLIGVSVSGLIHDNNQQYLLPVWQKKEKMARVMDKINGKYGDFTIKPAAVIISEKKGILERCGLIGTRQWTK